MKYSIYHIAAKLSFSSSHVFRRRRILTRRLEPADENKDIPSWALSPNLLARRLRPIFFPISVLPMNGHTSGVPVVPSGPQYYPNGSDDDFEVA